MQERPVRDLRDFYSILDQLEARVGGPRTLRECDGRLPWSRRGVYFFFETGELRSDSGEGQRVVRVGTHGLKRGSRTTLWQRLSQHRGTQRQPGGNHRGSIFRSHVGTALLCQNADLSCPSWGEGSSAPSGVRERERPVESIVSDVIGNMQLLWLQINGPPGPQSGRGYVERNAIALLSNFGKKGLDPPAATWLGRSCASDRVRRSGLWNSNHVDEEYDRAFLTSLERLVQAVPSP